MTDRSDRRRLAAVPAADVAGYARLMEHDTDGTAAAGLFERAIAIDPDYAAAHAGLALVRLHDWFHGDQPALERADRHACLADRLEPSLPAVHEAFGNVKLFARQHDAAIAAAERWVLLEPNSGDAHANLAGALTFGGRFTEVDPGIEQAMEHLPRRET